MHLSFPWENSAGFIGTEEKKGLKAELKAKRRQDIVEFYEIRCFRIEKSHAGNTLTWKSIQRISKAVTKVIQYANSQI